MFGDGFFGQWRLKLMSAFSTGLIASSSMLSAGNPEGVIKEIKKELRSDSLSFGFEALENFDTYKAYESLFSSMAGTPEMKQVKALFEISKQFNTELGVNDIDGYGSSTAKQGDMYDWDLFLHMKEGNEKSVLWKTMGGEAKELKTLKMLPENTILSLTVRMDIITLWKFLKEKLPLFNQMDPSLDIEGKLAMFEKMAAGNGMPVDAIAQSLTTEVTFALTINKDKKMMLPNMPPLPQMAATLIVQKNGDHLQSFILQALTGAPVKKLKSDGFDVVVIDSALPTGTKAGIAYDAETLILSSDIPSAKNVVAAKNGKGLLNSSKFAKFSSVPRSGNMAFYVSPDISNTISETAATLPPEVQMGIKTWSILLFENKTPELFMVMGKKKNGLKFDMNSSFNTSTTKMAAMTAAGTVGILAAMILPALGKARMKAKQAKSKSRLKQMGTTVAMYYADGGTTLYPKDLKKFDFDPYILAHPATDRQVTIADFEKGTADYMILFKPGKDQYSGAADKPLIMEKPGLWPDGRVQVVFEDGHVGVYFGKTVDEVLKAIKRGF